MSVVEDRNTPLNQDELIEIRLSDVVYFLRRSRRSILVGGLIGLVIGIVYAFSKSNEYTSQVTVMPEVQSKAGGALGNLGSLAGLAGINIDNLSSANDAIRPDLYPNVISSAPFGLDLLQKPVFSRQFKKTQPLDAYLIQHGESTFFGWFSKVLSFGSDNGEKTSDTATSTGLVQVTKKQDELIKELQSRVSAQYDKKTGIVTLVAQMPDPLVAATVAKLTLDFLTNYIISYRTEKARQQVEFLTRQVASAKRRYQETEVALSTYRDQNRSLFLNSAKIEEQRIQAEFMLAQDLYNNLSKQLEMAKIKVQEETPVFKTLDPPLVPLKKSSPKRMLIIIGFTIVGSIISLLLNVVKRVLANQHYA